MPFAISRVSTPIYVVHYLGLRRVMLARRRWDAKHQLELREACCVVVIILYQSSGGLPRPPLVPAVVPQHGHADADYLRHEVVDTHKASQNP
jgi:hypothetical protein